MIKVSGDRNVRVVYTNWRGVTKTYILRPVNLYYGSTDWHRDKQWLIQCIDQSDGTVKSFAMKDVKSWEPI